MRRIEMSTLSRLFVHERTNLILCRLAFVLFCLLPSMVIAGWAWRQTNSIELQKKGMELSGSLSARFGMAVAVHSLSHPHPARMIATHVTVHDNEGRRKLFECPKAEWDTVQSTLHIAHLQLSDFGLERLSDWIRHSCLYSSNQDVWRVSVDRLDLVWSDRNSAASGMSGKGLTFEGVHLDFEADSYSSHLKIHGRFRGDDRLFEFEVVRDRTKRLTRWQLGHVNDEWEWQQGKQGELPPPLPLAILYQVAPHLPDVGESAWLHGELQGVVHDDARQAAELRIRGVIQYFDTAAFSDFLPITGTMNLGVSEARFEGQKCTHLNAQFSFLGGSGVSVSTRQLQSLAQQYSDALLLVDRAASTQRLLPASSNVRKLALRVALTPKELKLSPFSDRGEVLATDELKLFLNQSLVIPRINDGSTMSDGKIE